MIVLTLKLRLLSDFNLVVTTLLKLPAQIASSLLEHVQMLHVILGTCIPFIFRIQNHEKMMKIVEW